MTEIWACARQDWQIGIGDPGVMGWLIVVLYVATAGLALRVAGRVCFPKFTQLRERLFWYLLAAILLLLAVNKQLDLQSLLTAMARCLAQIQGWYEARRAVQIGFIVWILVVMLIFFYVIWTLLHRTLRRNGLALVGLFFVLAFVVTRAASFHHMDRMIDMRISSVRLNWIFEMIGPVLIVIASLSTLRAARSQRNTRHNNLH